MICIWFLSNWELEWWTKKLSMGILGRNMEPTRKHTKFQNLLKVNRFLIKSVGVFTSNSLLLKIKTKLFDILNWTFHGDSAIFCMAIIIFFFFHQKASLNIAHVSSIFQKKWWYILWWYKESISKASPTLNPPLGKLVTWLNFMEPFNSRSIFCNWSVIK